MSSQSDRSTAAEEQPEEETTVTPPPAESEVEEAAKVSSLLSHTSEARPAVRFSAWRWALTGLVRMLYRRWTRIAAHLFPENSAGERMALALHVPLPDKLNMSWVNSQLAVGGRVRPEDIKALARVGITDVVDTRSEYSDDAQELQKEQIDLLYLPTPDTHPLSVEQLFEGAQWVHDRLSKGRRVLIHCEHGVGRSVLLTCAVLVYGGMHAYDALTLVQEKRWQAAPNHRQLTRLREFEAALRARGSK